MLIQILLTVAQRAKIAHFQEQNKFVAPNNERLDFERINENELMKGRRGHTICATDV